MRKWFLLFGASVLAVACGARTGLDVPSFHDAGSEGGSGSGGSAFLPDAGPDADADAPPDVPDVIDAAPDVPIDVPPPLDCQEAGITYIYVITEENDLYRFYPPDLSFTFIGTIACPTLGAGQPFSMAVDRKGKAYVVFSAPENDPDNGRLFEVSTANAACKATTFMQGQSDFTNTFGMGFSADTSDPDETLFVVGEGDPEPLASIDVDTFNLNLIGSFNSSIGNSELTGTGDGRLFAFGIDQTQLHGHLAEIDKTNANVKTDLVLATVGTGTTVAWAFAFWGGDFFFFTSSGQGSSIVTRYQPESGQETDVAKLDKTIVGAGVSTCAPQSF